MSSPTPSPPDTNQRWYQRKSTAWLLGVLALILLALLIAETLIMVWQHQATASIQARSKTAMAAYSKSGEEAKQGGKGGVHTALNNVYFCWTQATCAQIETLSGTLVPDRGDGIVNADDPMSFHASVDSGHVLIEPSKFAGMLNDSVFNYPESALRDLEVGIEKDREQKNQLRIRGKIHIIFWIPFDMVAKLSIDQKSNTLMMTVQDLDVLEIVPATWAIEIKPFNLDKMLPLPKNNHLSIKKNNILIKPFGLFPPPRIQANMGSLEVQDKLIRLTFAGKSSKSTASNTIKLQGGTMAFGKLMMRNTDITVVDADKKDPLALHLNSYQQVLPSATPNLQANQSVVVSMPDAS